MPVYNSERFVAEAIDSILQQTLTDFEFLIVDDGSTDGSLGIIQDRAERDPRIRIFQHPENLGPAVARTTSMAHVNGKYITGMDSDDVSLPQRLEKQVAFLDAHPEIGAVGVSHHVCDENLMVTLSKQLPARHYFIVLHQLLYTMPTMKRSPIMVRTEYLDMEPLYDLSMVISSDVDMFLRLLGVKKIRFANLTEQLYMYRRHEHSLGHRHRAIALEATIRARLPALRQLGDRGIGIEWIILRQPLNKFSWRERRRARRDITRLIEAMVEHNWVDAVDKPLLYAEMNHLLESTTPRYWQMFLHWYRYRIARRLQR